MIPVESYDKKTPGKYRAEISTIPKTDSFQTKKDIDPKF